jgi:hypothetical protein
MKKYILPLFAGVFAITSAQAGQYVLGMNFVITHPTTISAMGAYDGGAPFTSSETIGVFNDLTGNLVGSEAFFGPGHAGQQVGNTFYENVSSFVLAPGDYSIISTSTGGSLPTGTGIAGGNNFQSLGNALNLPDGGRFDFGTGFNVALSEGSGIGSHSRPLVLVDPPGSGAVPDAGLTATLLGASLTGLGLLRRKI